MAIIGGIPHFQTYPYVILLCLPSGELTKNYGQSPFLMGKSTISMAIFNCYVSSPEGNQSHWLYQVASAIIHYYHYFDN